MRQTRIMPRVLLRIPDTLVNRVIVKAGNVRDRQSSRVMTGFRQPLRERY